VFDLDGAIRCAIAPYRLTLPVSSRKETDNAERRIGELMDDERKTRMLAKGANAEPRGARRGLLGNPRRKPRHIASRSDQKLEVVNALNGADGLRGEPADDDDAAVIKAVCGADGLRRKPIYDHTAVTPTESVDDARRAQ